MTWSIVGRDSTGTFGIAIASRFFTAGAKLGQHAQHRQKLRQQRTLDFGVAGALSIFLLALPFNPPGDGLRDAFDPRHK